MKGKALKRGLDALIDMDVIQTEGSSAINQIPINQIMPNPEQPRQVFDEEALEELATSIRELGIIQPLTLRSMGGINGWFTTYAESIDFCRRVSRSGGRVLVVPQARIAHRRARYEGVRTRNGEEVDEELPVKPSMSVLVAEQRYQYTDIARLRWPLIWIFSLFAAFFKTLARLVKKQPYEAWCELCMPWHALTSVTSGIQARAMVARQSKVPHAQLNMITATRTQLAQWHDRRNALDGQRNVTLLSPLVRSHLRIRAVKRWSAALAMAAVAFVAVAVIYWPVLRALFSGGSLYSNQLLPTGATFGQLAEAASTQWVWNIGGGVSMPPAPWLWVLLATSLFTLGNVAAATGLLFFLICFLRHFLCRIRLFLEIFNESLFQTGFIFFRLQF